MWHIAPLSSAGLIEPAPGLICEHHLCRISRYFIKALSADGSHRNAYKGQQDTHGK